MTNITAQTPQRHDMFSPHPGILMNNAEVEHGGGACVVVVERFWYRKSYVVSHGTSKQ